MKQPQQNDAPLVYCENCIWCRLPHEKSRASIAVLSICAHLNAQYEVQPIGFVVAPKGEPSISQKFCHSHNPSGHCPDYEAKP